MNSSKSKRDSGTGRTLMVGSAILFGGGLLLVLLYTGAHVQSIGVGLLTALAALVAGSLIGFLFGIRRLLTQRLCTPRTTGPVSRPLELIPPQPAPWSSRPRRTGAF